MMRETGAVSMFIIIVIALLLGIWRFRSAEYFKWVGITFVWMFASRFLLSGGGTLDNPAGDGLIAHQVRVAANDGPIMALFAIGVVVLLWGGIIYFLNRARKAARAVKAANEAASLDPDYVEKDDADTSRKALETIGLLLVAGGWFYFNFSALMSARKAPAPTAQAPAPVTAPAQPTVEQDVMGAASEINANTPEQIDPDTVLERASASGRTLTYHYKLKTKGAGPDRLRRVILSNVVPKVCTSGLRTAMKEHGVSYAYNYDAPGFGEPVEVTVSEATCAKLERPAP